MPLPKHIDSNKVLAAINPDKDVDGFHVVNVGRLSTGQDSLVPCTPVGSVMLAKHALGSLEGLEAVVIGRSNIVGKPVAQLLLAENCTVTVCHSRSKDLPSIVKRADLVIAAVGRPEMVKGEWLKPGACVIDVGINRIERDGKGKLVGDCDFSVLRKSCWLDHAGARRRRPDDDCLPLAQHGSRRLCAGWCQGSGVVLSWVPLSHFAQLPQTSWGSVKEITLPQLCWGRCPIGRRGPCSTSETPRAVPWPRPNGFRRCSPFKGALRPRGLNSHL